jgi:hypothetical protein
MKCRKYSAKKYFSQKEYLLDDYNILESTIISKDISFNFGIRFTKFLVFAVLLFQLKCAECMDFQGEHNVSDRMD